MNKRYFPAKRMLAILIMFAVMCTVTGCTENSPSKAEAGSDSYENDDTVSLIYYTIGNPDEDLSRVNEALNRILRERYNLTIDYRKVDWSDYDSRITSIVNAGVNFDIAFVAGPEQGDYAKQAARGAWLNLDEFLQGEGKEIYDNMSPVFWQGVTIDGSIYGIPTNKEVAVPEYFIFPEELVKKYGIDISQIHGLEDLRDIFALIHANEPEYLVLELDKNSNSFFAIDGYEYIINKEIPLVVNYNDEKLEVLNIYETEDARRTLDILREYFLAGYINQDAAIRNCSVLEKGKKVFCKMGSGGPYSETSWSLDRGYSVVSQQITDSVATTESTRGAIMIVNSLCKDKEACYRFLLAVNTDPDVRNMLNYGIEGVHYELDENDQVVILSDKYTGVQYTQGNWFILKTRQGEPKNKWDIYREFNDNVVASKLLGFSADTSRMQKQLSDIRTVWSKYYPALMTGSVSVDEFLPKFVKELKEAGIDEVREELQKQIDEWSRN